MADDNWRDPAALAAIDAMDLKQLRAESRHLWNVHARAERLVQALLAVPIKVGEVEKFAEALRAMNDLDVALDELRPKSQRV